MVNLEVLFVIEKVKTNYNNGSSQITGSLLKISILEIN